MFLRIEKSAGRHWWDKLSPKTVTVLLYSAYVKVRLCTNPQLKDKNVQTQMSYYPPFSKKIKYIPVPLFQPLFPPNTFCRDIFYEEYDKLLCENKKQRHAEKMEYQIHSLEVNFSDWLFCLLLLPLCFIGQILHQKNQRNIFLPYTTPYLIYQNVIIPHESCSIYNSHSMDGSLQTNSWPVKIPHRGFKDMHSGQGHLQLWKGCGNVLKKIKWKKNSPRYISAFSILSPLCPLSCFQQC